MTVLSHQFVGTPDKPRYITVYETPYGMLLNEGYYKDRICGGEQASYDFILEIAESTLPFRNIANLLQNLVRYTDWTSTELNLRLICDQIIEACEKAADPTSEPATMASLGYANFTLNDGRHVGVPASEKVDMVGRDQKYYPHTYEAILRPWMIPTLDRTIDEVAEKREEREIRWGRARRIDEARRRVENDREASSADQGDC